MLQFDRIGVRGDGSRWHEEVLRVREEFRRHRRTKSTGQGVPVRANAVSSSTVRDAT